MNITQFIKSNKDLKDLPFLIVFRTIQVLRELKMLKLEAGANGVEDAQS